MDISLCCFPLTKLFLQGAPCHTYTHFLELSLLCEGAFYFYFDLAKLFFQGATMPTLHQKFLDYSLLWEGVLCFSFDLARVFLQVAIMPPYTHFLLLFIIVGRGIVLLLRHSQVIFSGCHHATHIPKHFWLIHCGKGHYDSAST